MNNNSFSSQNTHPTIQNNYPWWILEGLSHIRTEASAQGFDEFLSQNPPIRPLDIPGATDKQRKDRLDLQRDYDQKIGRFLATIKSMAEKSPYKSGISRFLTKKQPLLALQYIGDAMIRESGLSSAFEIMDKFFDTYSKSGRFPNQGSLDQDLTHATNMINLAAESFEMQPLPPSHPTGQPHPDKISSTQKAVWLRKLLMPHARFQPIFAANQVPQTKYKGMINEIETAIKSINQYKAYAGLEASAEQTKLNHTINEVAEQDTSEKAATAQENSNQFRGSQRTRNWQSYNQSRDNNQSRINYNSHEKYSSPRGRSPTPYYTRSNHGSTPNRNSNYYQRSNSNNSQRSYGS